MTLQPKLQQSTIVMGDFSMMESAMDHWQSKPNTKEASRWPGVCSLLHPLVLFFQHLHPQLQVYSFIQISSKGGSACQGLAADTSEANLDLQSQLHTTTQIDHCFAQPPPPTGPADVLQA